MATTNPYDRREDAKRQRERGMGYVDVDGYSGDLLADGRRAYPGFTLAKLEELLRDEYARGYNCGEGTMERRVEGEILPRVKRQVWDEGRAAGLDEGESEVLGRIEELYGEKAHELLADARDAQTNPDATAEVLRSLLSRTVKLLAQLVEAHHGGFAHPDSSF
jgi:hypothetical protein